MIQNVIGWVFKLVGLRQSVRVLCHVAMFKPNGPMCLFINVVNLSLQRDIEITHVWVEHHGQIPVLNSKRKLPYRLKPDESWETWIELTDLPTSIIGKASNLARIRLSNGKVIKSKPNKNVPSEGYVPGS
jgi:hypothetical protein